MHTSKIILCCLIGLMTPVVIANDVDVNPAAGRPVVQIMEISNLRPIEIKESVVLRQKQQLDSLFYWNKVVRYSVTGVLAGFALYSTYEGLNWFFSTPDQKPLWNAEKQARLDQLLKREELVEAKDTIMGTRAPNSRIITLRNFLLTNMPSLSFALLSFLGTQHLDKLFYFKDMRWFVNQRTHLTDALEELQIHAAAFDGRASLPDYKVAYSTIAFEEVLRDAVTQIEKIIAFMEHLIDQEVAQKHIVPSDLYDTPRILLRVVNDYCGKMHGVLHAYHTQQPAALIAGDAISFCKEVQQIVDTYNHFNDRIEVAQQALVHPLPVFNDEQQPLN